MCQFSVATIWQDIDVQEEPSIFAEAANVIPTQYRKTDDENEGVQLYDEKKRGNNGNSNFKKIRRVESLGVDLVCPKMSNY